MTFFCARFFYGAALTAWSGLILLSLLWELWLAPLHPGGSWLVLKVLPLCLALPGLLQQRSYVMQWSSMLVLFYLAEGVTRAMSDMPLSHALFSSNVLAWIEALLALVYFFCVLAYVAPHKKAYKKAKAESKSSSKI